MCKWWIGRDLRKASASCCGWAAGALVVTWSGPVMTVSYLGGDLEQHVGLYPHLSRIWAGFE